MKQLRDYQIEALNKLHNGSILCGGVGSGKSITGLAYYYICQGGHVMNGHCNEKLINPKSLIIITTARKRDTKEWESELDFIKMNPETKLYSNEVIIDSWNNIKKYEEVKNSFFLFDEQRVVGYGAWTKSFLKITKSNEWILLSATPGDTWQDYIPVFIANGFYKNKTEFSREHIVYSRYCSFPKVDRYLNTGRLIRLRNNILVNMEYEKPAEQKHVDIITDYDRAAYKKLLKERFNYEKEEPIQSASELCYELRKIPNRDNSKKEALIKLIADHPMSIIFYNFDYELEDIKETLETIGIEYAEWNGHKHQPIPNGYSWAYLVQYNAGAEGWNCIATDTIIFYSQNYSYKIMIQSAGRIDRMNTKFKELYYYHLKTNSSIDIAIQRALNNKKNFNEGRFALSQ